MRKLFRNAALFVILVLLIYLLFFPVPFDPVAYTPPKNPGLTGQFSRNNTLQTTERLLNGMVKGPEDIALGPDSLLYTGLNDGSIVQFTREGEHMGILTNTGGRPLGMQFDATGRLIVADEYKGLLSIDTVGNIDVLADSADGTPIFFADDLDIAEDGTIWFTDATQRYHANQHLMEYIELQPTGRLLSYHPATKETKVEWGGLRFPNGVALGPDDAYVLVNETVGMKIVRFWLKGPKKGSREVFLQEIPGYPDNISFNENGIFWVAFPAVRTSKFEFLYEKPFWRKIIARLPPSWTAENPAPPYTMVIGLDTSGQVVYNFQDTATTFHSITSVNEYAGYLFLGSNKMGAIGRFKLKN